VADAERAGELLSLTATLKEGLETLRAPDRAGALVDLRRIKDWLEYIKRRGEAETAAAARGIGVPARYRRLR
jgi:hypothetical protein